MKKTLSILALLLIAICGSVNAADFGGKKFYVNPGHGGHDSDDRPTPLPLGVEIFYESDGTLTRGKYLKTFFEENNGAVKMSRTTNTTADDLALSTIAAQSNSYGGYFISLHTNGANASANYVCSFYRGSNVGVISGAVAFAKAAVDWHNDNHMTNTTYATPRAIDDYSFYGYNLGVLRTNTRPGYLVESWFHDYRPDALRMKTNAYNKFLAWQLCRAALQSPGGSGTMKGCIIGDIRDTAKGCGYSNYVSRGRDTYLAINSATVTLRNSSGTKVASFTTSAHCNGFYAFFDVDPGTYTVEVAKDGYANQSASVTVANNATSKHNFNLKEGPSTGLTATATDHDFGSILVDSVSTWNVVVTGTNLSDKIAVANSNTTDFTVSATSLAKTGGTLTITCQPKKAGAISGVITLTSGTYTEKISVKATSLNPTLKFSGKIYVGDNWSSKPIPTWVPKNADGTADWSRLRNMAYGNGKLYVVNNKDGIIYVIKAQTFEHLYNLDMTGVEGGTYAVMDVKVNGKKILACNLTTEITQPTKVYMWDDDFAKPKCILNTTARSNMARMGDTFDIQGNLTSGRLIFTGHVTTNGNTALRYFDFVDGVLSTKSGNNSLQDIDKNQPAVGNSPRLVSESGKKMWFVSSESYPLLCDSTGKNGIQMNPKAFKNIISGNDIVTFKFKGDQYACASMYLQNGSTYSSSATHTVTATDTEQGGKLVTIDCRNGWADAAFVQAIPAVGLSMTRNVDFSTSVEVAVNGEDGVEAWLLVTNQGMAYYQSQNGTFPTWTYDTNEDPSADASLTTDANEDVTDFGEVEIGQTHTHAFTVFADNVSSEVTLSLSGADAARFSLDKTSIVLSGNKAEGLVKITYTPTEAKTDEATITIATKDLNGNAKNIVLNIKGDGYQPGSTVIGDESTLNLDEVEELWIYSTNKGNLAQATWYEPDLTALYARDLATNGKELYLLSSHAYSTPTIAILAAETGTKAGDVNMTGIEGGLFSGASIETLGGQLLMSNAARYAGYGTETTTDALKIYKWSSPTAAPTVWLSDATHGSIHVGEIMSVAGDMTNGRIYFSDGKKVLKYTVTNGNISASATTISLTDAQGAAYNCNELNHGVVKVMEDNDGSLWIVGKDDKPTHFSSAGKYIDEITLDEVGGSMHGTNVDVINVNNQKFATAITYLENATSGTKSLTGGTMSLIDLSNGATRIGQYPSQGLGSTRNTSFMSSLTSAVADNKKSVDMYMLVPAQGIAKYRVNSKESSVDAIGINQIAILVEQRMINVIGSIPASIELYDLSGRKVGQTSGNSTLNAENMQSGIYIVNTISNDGQRKTQKVVLK